MVIAYIFEFLATFFLFSVILIQGKVLPIVVTVAAAIFFAGPVSGAHFNPAVTYLTALKDPSFDQFIPYVIAQFIGATAAYYFFVKWVQPIKIDS